MLTADIAIVGGGIWGCCTAWQLVTKFPGIRVVLLERGPAPGGETTWQSAGQVGQLRGDPLLVQVVGITLNMLRNWRLQTGTEAGWVPAGSVHLSLTPRRTQQFKELVQIATSLGVAAELIEPAAAAEKVHGLRTESIHSAVWVPGDGYTSARQTCSALASSAAAHGCQMRFNARVVEWQRPLAGGLLKVARLQTDQGEEQLEAAQWVVCGGPWTRELLKPLGIFLPCFPIRLQQARTVSVHLPALQPVVRVPDVSCYLRPEAGGWLYGFFDPEPLAVDLTERSATFGTHDLPPDESLLVEAQARLAEVVPRLAELPLDHYRQGLITCSPDGKLVLGKTSECENLVVATGCGGTGIALCGAVGSWLADLAMQRIPAEDLSPYAPDRFADRAANDPWLKEAARATSQAYYRLPAAALS